MKKNKSTQRGAMRGSALRVTDKKAGGPVDVLFRAGAEAESLGDLKFDALMALSKLSGAIKFGPAYYAVNRCWHAVYLLKLPPPARNEAGSAYPRPTADSTGSNP